MVQAFNKEKKRMSAKGKTISCGGAGQAKTEQSHAGGLVLIGNASGTCGETKGQARGKGTMSRKHTRIDGKSGTFRPQRMLSNSEMVTR